MTNSTVRRVLDLKVSLAALVSCSSQGAIQAACARCWLRVLAFEEPRPGLCILATTSGTITIATPCDGMSELLADELRTDCLWVKWIDGAWETKMDTYRLADWQKCGTSVVDYGAINIMDSLRRM